MVLVAFTATLVPQTVFADIASENKPEGNCTEKCLNRYAGCTVVKIYNDDQNACMFSCPTGSVACAICGEHMNMSSDDDCPDQVGLENKSDQQSEDAQTQ